MRSLVTTSFPFRLASVVAVFTLTSVAVAQRPLTRVTYDPGAEQVEFFEAIDEGRLEVQMIPRDAFGGNLLIKNPEKEPLTVKAPTGFVGVPINAQFGGMGGGMGGMGGGMGGMGGGMGGMGGGMGGGGQSVGGGMGGGMGGMGGGMGGMGGGMGGMGGGMGGGLFSIPAEKTVRIPYQSICLEHGKVEPYPKMRYRPIPMEEFSDNPVLHSLIELVGTGKTDAGAAQAAAWHLASGMSWNELAMKPYDAATRPNVPYFNRAQLMGAQSLVMVAQQKATEEKVETAEEPAPQYDRRARMNTRR